MIDWAAAHPVLLGLGLALTRAVARELRYWLSKGQ